MVASHEMWCANTVEITVEKNLFDVDDNVRRIWITKKKRTNPSGKEEARLRN